MPNALPLYVDVDGTLIATDCLYESFLRLIRQNPLYLFSVIIWMLKGGRALLKANIAQRVDLAVSTLPYNQALINWLTQEKARGRRLVLATASHQKYADAIAKHLGIFDAVIASSDKHNLKGNNKAQQLISEAGEQGFDYAGDSKADFKVWKHANAAVVISNSSHFINEIKNICPISQRFNSLTTGWSPRIFHPFHWLINAVIFLALYAQVSVLSTNPFITIAAFIAFSLFTTGLMISFDLLNLEQQRQKNAKPSAFATGQTSILLGILLCAGLLFSATIIGLFIFFVASQ